MRSDKLDRQLTLFDRIELAGVPHTHHYSDLYIPVNPVTRRLIAEYQYRDNVTQFVNNLDGQPWYDVPFAYIPFWEARHEVSK